MKKRRLPKHLFPNSVYAYVLPTDRMKFKSLFSECFKGFNHAKSIIEGSIGGMIVDSLQSPNVGRLWSGIDNFFGGDPNHKNARYILPQLPGTYHMLFPSDSEWPEFLFGIYGDKLQKYPYLQLRMLEPDIDKLLRLTSKVLPKGLYLTWIDYDSAVVMEKQETQEDDYCGIPKHYNSAEDFVCRSFGFCIRDEGKVFSRTTSNYPSDSMIEVEVETRLEFQNQGLSTTASAAFILYCLENGLTPIWNTNHTISAKLAEKLGFQLVDASESVLLSKGIFDPANNVDFNLRIPLKRFGFGKINEYPHIHEVTLENE